MPELAPWALPFIVEVKVSVGQFQYPFNVAVLADDINHAAQAACLNVAQSVSADRANVILELAGHGAFDAPVAGIVHSGCHFVGYQSFRCFEQFDG